MAGGNSCGIFSLINQNVKMSKLKKNQNVKPKKKMKMSKFKNHPIKRQTKKGLHHAREPRPQLHQTLAHE
jgi:hypothetical protein